MKNIIGMCILIMLMIGCKEQKEQQLNECTDSINNQYYVEACEQYEGYEYHYDLRKEYEANLPNSSYIIERHYDECLWDNDSIYYLDYSPLQKNINQIGIQVDCPKDADIVYGAVFCYKEYISCNETWYYKNGTKEKHNFATARKEK